MDIEFLLNLMVEKGASDLHLIHNVPATLRIDGELISLSKDIFTERQIRVYLDSLLEDETKKKRFYLEKELDFAYELKGRARFRINAYFQRGSVALSIRYIPISVPDMEELNLPKVLKEITRKQNGLVLVTGPTGSGKSTTLAAMINIINQERPLHIVTIEDPIEYVYTSKKAVISQREVGEDTSSFANALKHVLRQDPDVILIGEMRDVETMQAAITAAETGHLVFSTLHTTSASQTIERIIDVFPPHQQNQIRSQLSITLQAVITQRLVKRLNIAGRLPVTEVLITNYAIKNLIREAKTYQIYSIMESGAELGMHTMEQSINELLLRRAISWEDAYSAANMVEYLKK
ncbi:MAG TPA: type IV pilus twitching motility protein PilT [Syntrophorhabdaceae bacterium]|nr:type IV pilus twitching motility protein PilT [Syntrophorhabdaceae bacterium]